MKHYMEVTHDEIIVLHLWSESIMADEVEVKIERAVMLGMALDAMPREARELLAQKIVLAHRGMHEGGSCEE